MPVTDDIRCRIEAVWRIEAPRLIGSLARTLRDFGLAEEVAQDALVAALETWPIKGVPERPGAWLLTTARRRAIDILRHATLASRKHQLLEHDMSEWIQSDGESSDSDDELGDDLLRLIFIACHPVLSIDGCVALTLRVLGGLTTPEIARAFLVPESTVFRRVVRAKKVLAEKNVPFELPAKAELGPRLASALEVVYLIFNEGYVATSGDDWMRPLLCAQALRLGRTIVSLAASEAEVHGLIALMELQASRLASRVDATGRPILLAAQDRSRWDAASIRRGLAALAHAEALGGADGSYALQAALSACHARAEHHDATDWARIVALYTRLASVAPSPVVQLNRAVALAMRDGPQAGLDALAPLAHEPRMAGYHLLPGVRGDLLERLGRLDEARAEFEQAAALASNGREREFLLERAAGLGPVC